ncbi:hypothetical protein [uncultured Alistipes sp.]|uniref:hypothetical protein n=1 Tax=uncultured Alistipes sp. TaxID=538949 RepID=UPI002604C0F9|nr:hypothetical protein [uncultured Alistipes sp.]
MEEKKLDAQESIELITRMIRNTRQRLERHSGRPFLIWGYTTVAVSLLNYSLNIAGADPAWSLSWFLIPVLGILLMRLFPEKKSSEPRTEIDRIVNSLWIVCSLALVPIFLFSFLHGLSYRPSLFALITLVMAIGTAATGLIVRSKVYTVAGFLAMAGSVLFALHDFRLGRLAQTAGIDAVRLNNEILIFAAIFVVMMVIPGHIINRRSRHEKQEPCSRS